MRLIWFAKVIGMIILQINNSDIVNETILTNAFQILIFRILSLASRRSEGRGRHSELQQRQKTQGRKITKIDVHTYTLIENDAS